MSQEDENVLSSEMMKTVEKVTRKRRFSSNGEDGGAIPRSKVSKTGEDDDDYEAPGIMFKLTHFSDEILYEIFKHLSSADLRSLMYCEPRFYTLILDRRFWVNIDLWLEPLPLNVLGDILMNCGCHTKSIKCQGVLTNEKDEIEKFNRTLRNVLRVKCSELTVLELKSVTLPFQTLRIIDYPAKLKRLVFDGCKIWQHDGIRNVFSGIDVSHLQLEQIAVEYCDWFEPSSLMMFSKMSNLRWLSLKGCPQLRDIVPYASMAARFGFKKLEYLDLSFTPVGDSDLQCFNAVVTLKVLRLDYPSNLRNEFDAAVAAQEALEEPQRKRVRLMNLTDSDSDDSGSKTGSSSSSDTDSAVVLGEAPQVQVIRLGPPTGENALDLSLPESNGLPTLNVTVNPDLPSTSKNSTSAPAKIMPEDARSSIANMNENADSPSTSKNSTSSDPSVPAPNVSNISNAFKSQASSDNTKNTNGNSNNLKTTEEKPTCSRYSANAAFHRTARASRAYRMLNLPNANNNLKRALYQNINGNVQALLKSQSKCTIGLRNLLGNCNNSAQCNASAQPQSTDATVQLQADDPPAQPLGNDSPAQPESSDSPAQPESSDSPAQLQDSNPIALPEGNDSPAQLQDSNPIVLPEGDDSPAQHQGNDSPAQLQGNDPPAQLQGNDPPAHLLDNDPLAQLERNYSPAQPQPQVHEHLGHLQVNDPLAVPEGNDPPAPLQANELPAQPQGDRGDQFIAFHRYLGEAEEMRMLGRGGQRIELRNAQFRLLQNAIVENGDRRRNLMDNDLDINALLGFIEARIENQVEGDFEGNLEARRARFVRVIQARDALPPAIQGVQQVVRHPLFWDMLYPHGRRANMPNFPRFYITDRSNLPRQTPQPYQPITNRSICSFGRPNRQVDQGIIWIRIGNRPANNSFERLSIRNYTGVTDLSLSHLVQCSPNLVFLDLTGTGVTLRGVQLFRASKPDCMVIADHLTESNAENEENDNENEDEEEAQ